MGTSVPSGQTFTLCIGDYVIGAITRVAGSIGTGEQAVPSFTGAISVSLGGSYKHRRRFRHWLKAHGAESNNWRRNHGKPSRRTK